MSIHRLFFVGSLIGAFLFFSVLLSASPASAQTCADGRSAPCGEDPVIEGCTLCHSHKIIGGTRDGTDRWIFVSSGTMRHELASRRDDWTSTVQSMIAKGTNAILNLAAGYLNTNYCLTCNGPILGSPQPSDITQTTATVTWSTSAIGFEDEPTDTTLFIGTDEADVLLGPGCASCTTLSDPTPVAHHVVSLTGLSPGTRYFLVNQATSARGTVRSKYAVRLITRRPPATGAIPSLIFVSNNPSSGIRSIVVIDPETNTEVGTIEVLGDPGELASNPNGKTVYAMVGANLLAIDVADTSNLTTVTGVGDLFNHLAVHPDGSRVYVASRRSTGTATLQIKVIETAGNTVIGTISDTIFNGCYGPLGLGVHPSGSTLYLACRDIAGGTPDRLFTIDTATNAVTQTATFARDSSNNLSINSIAVTPDGSRVLVGRVGAPSTVEIFDAATGANTGRITLPTDALPRGMAVTPSGSRLYVADQRVGSHVIDLATDTIIANLGKTKGRGFDMGINTRGDRAYLTLLGQIFVFDTAANAWVQTITGSFSSLSQITVSPGAGLPPVPPTIYLSDRPSRSTHRVVAIDPEFNELSAEIEVFGDLTELAPHPDGRTLYAMIGSSLGVINVADNIQDNEIPGVGGTVGNFNHIAVHPNGNQVFVAGTVTPFALEIKVVDPAAGSVTGTITSPAFSGCYAALGLSIHPSGSTLYAACRDSDNTRPNRFYTIDTATNVVTQTATFGRDSTNLAMINAMAITPDGAKVFFIRASSTVSTVEVFDGATGASLATIPLPVDSLPRAGVVTKDGSRLYVVDQRLGTHVIDVAANGYSATLDRITTRGLDIAIHPDGTKIYLTLLSNVSILDPATNTRTSVISGGFRDAYQITVTPGAQ